MTPVQLTKVVRDLFEEIDRNDVAARSSYSMFYHGPVVVAPPAFSAQGSVSAVTLRTVLLHENCRPSALWCGVASVLDRLDQVARGHLDLANLVFVDEPAFEKVDDDVPPWLFGGLHVWLTVGTRLRVPVLRKLLGRKFTPTDR